MNYTCNKQSFRTANGAEMICPVWSRQRRNNEVFFKISPLSTTTNTIDNMWVHHIPDCASVWPNDALLYCKRNVDAELKPRQNYVIPNFVEGGPYVCPWHIGLKADGTVDSMVIADDLQLKSDAVDSVKNISIPNDMSTEASSSNQSINISSASDIDKKTCGKIFETKDKLKRHYRNHFKSNK